MINGPSPVPVRSGVAPTAPKTAASGRPSTSFASLLKVSRHAQTRIEGSLSAPQRSALQHALTSLEQRGARSSLVMVGDTGYLVAVPTRTIVTAFSGERLSGSVITGVDSVYVAKME